jgi:hypothetical protein
MEGWLDFEFPNCDRLTAFKSKKQLKRTRANQAYPANPNNRLTDVRTSRSRQLSGLLAANKQFPSVHRLQHGGGESLDPA